MELYQFKLLTESEQNEILNTKARCLAERLEEHYSYKLYQIDSFYIEEKWHVIFNERRAIASFVSLEALQPYLEVIDISTLLNG